MNDAPHTAQGKTFNVKDDQTELLGVRSQRLAVQAHGWLMVHAGVLPCWTASQTLALAGEVEAVLRGPDLVAFLRQMYVEKCLHSILDVVL